MIPFRTLSFIGMTLCALFLPVWAFILLAPLYAFVFSPYELLVLGVCIDAQFGEVGRGVWCLYTVITAGVTIFSMSVRPFLRFYA